MKQLLTVKATTEEVTIIETSWECPHCGRKEKTQALLWCDVIGCSHCGQLFMIEIHGVIDIGGKRCGIDVGISKVKIKDDK